MSLNLARETQIKASYERVYGVQSDAKTAVIVLENILYYMDNLAHEPDDVRDFRLSNVTDVEDHSIISEWVSKIDFTVFEGKYASTLDKAFYLGKISSVGESTGAVTTKPEVEQQINDTKYDVQPSVDVAVESDSHKQKENNLEVVNMNEQINTVETRSKFDEIQAQYGSSPIGDPVDPAASVPSNVSGVSSDAKKAAAAVVAKTQQDRLAFTRNASISRVLITKSLRVEKACDGLNAKGTVVKPAEALRAFRARVGFDDSGPEIKFTRLAEGESVENAKKILSILELAVNNPETPVDVFFGDVEKPNISIKGWKLRYPDGKIETVSVQDITKILLNKSIGVINVENVDGAQLSVEGTRVTNNRTPKRPYSLRIANRSGLLDDDNAVIVIKNKTDNVSDMTGGFKSQLSCKYISSTVREGQEPKVVTYRIPLNVKQFEYVVPEEYKSLFGRGVGSKVAVDINDEEVISKLVDSVSSLIASITGDNKSVGMLEESVKSDILKERETIGAAGAASAADEINDVEL